ncbi:MAG TPA: hydrogenase maturation nickel metallochaperone HypA [Eggerthellaceae bacterium]|nr:hydrogenase maturation nickel metallochaperone HypA [Eggerthellaceae bacterium]
MHEMGIIAGVLDVVNASAADAGANRVLCVNLRVGDMTEAIEDALQFAFEALSEGTPCEGARLAVEWVAPTSMCFECATEFEHDRFHRTCPACGSYETVLLTGRELEIASIEVDLPDDGGTTG